MNVRPSGSEPGAPGEAPAVHSAGVHVVRTALRRTPHPFPLAVGGFVIAIGAYVAALILFALTRDLVR